MTAPETTPELLLERAIELIADLRSYTHEWDWKYGEEWDREIAALCLTSRTPTTGGEEDTARLDWLEAHPGYILDEQCGIWCCYPEATEAPDNYQGDTARAAIDAAIAADAARTTRSTGEE